MHMLGFYACILLALGAGYSIGVDAEHKRRDWQRLSNEQRTRGRRSWGLNVGSAGIAARAARRDAR
jgi:hypothetical protein